MLGIKRSLRYQVRLKSLPELEDVFKSKKDIFAKNASIINDFEHIIQNSFPSGDILLSDDELDFIEKSHEVLKLEVDDLAVLYDKILTLLPPEKLTDSKTQNDLTQISVNCEVILIQ